MRIYTKIVYDKNIQLIEAECDWYEYFGKINHCKGNASKNEQSAADTQRTQENQLMQQQLAMQQQQLAGVNAVADPAIAAGGMFPGQEAAMTSLLTNNLANTYRQGIGNVNQGLVARGLSGGQGGAGGGAVAGNLGMMSAMLGNQQQQGLSDIQLAKAQQMQGLLGLKLGIGSQYGGNVGGFNQGALSALGQGVQAAKNVDEAQTSWMGPVFGALGGMGSSLMTGGMSNLGKGTGFFGCWIASECFGGMEMPKVQFIRMRLFHNAQQDWRFKVILAAYAVFGKTVAKLVRRFAWLKRKFTNVFDKFVINEIDKLLNEAING